MRGTYAALHKPRVKTLAFLFTQRHTRSGSRQQYVCPGVQYTKKGPCLEDSFLRPGRKCLRMKTLGILLQ